MSIKAIVVVLVLAGVCVDSRPPQFKFAIEDASTENLKLRIFTSEEFAELIQLIWDQLAEQYITPRPSSTPATGEQQPISPQGDVQTKSGVASPIDTRALKASIISSETFNNFVNYIWEEILHHTEQSIEQTSTEVQNPSVEIGTSTETVMLESQPLETSDTKI